MPHYKVRWEIDIEDAEGPLEAALRARYYQTKPGTTATVFEVFETEPTARTVAVRPIEVDLGGPDEPGHVDGEPLLDTAPAFV